MVPREGSGAENERTGGIDGLSSESRRKRRGVAAHTHVNIAVAANGCLRDTQHPLSALTRRAELC